METRSGEMVSAQVAVFGDIDAMALTKNNFKLQKGGAFVIKNEGTEPVRLWVLPAGSQDGAFVETTFDTGWNPELIREIKVTSLANLKIKYGY